jgi:hypothetical protein
VRTTLDDTYGYTEPSFIERLTRVGLRGVEAVANLVAGAPDYLLGSPLFSRCVTVLENLASKTESETSGSSPNGRESMTRLRDHSRLLLALVAIEDRDVRDRIQRLPIEDGAGPPALGVTMIRSLRRPFAINLGERFTDVVKEELLALGSHSGGVATESKSWDLGVTALHLGIADPQPMLSALAVTPHAAARFFLLEALQQVAR